LKQEVAMVTFVLHMEEEKEKRVRQLAAYAPSPSPFVDSSSCKAEACLSETIHGNKHHCLPLALSF